MALLAIVVGAIALLGLRFADDGVLYYRTPSELTGAEDAWSETESETTRLSGLVVPGSVQRSAEESRLRLTDGGAEVDVWFGGRLPATVVEGQGAVVEGRMTKAGLFQAERVLLRHSNEYRPAESR